MQIITSPKYYEPYDQDISVFLAGGITNCKDWQKEVINQIKHNHGDSFLDNLIIFNPRRDNFPINDRFATYQQIEWEFNAIEKCNVFSMYFCSGDSDQPICMYELGRNILKMQLRYPTDWQDRIVISVEDGYKRKQDVLIQTDLATNNKIPINIQVHPQYCLEDHAENIIKAFKKLR